MVTKLFQRILRLSKYSSLSLVALFIGFWREIVVSSHFGLSEELDVYVAILGFYLFFGVQIANTLEMVFISKGVKIESEEQITAQLFNAGKILLIINIIVAVVLHNYGKVLITLFFPGFSIDQISLATLFIDYFILAIFFANFAGLFRASLNILKIFSPGLLSGAIVSLISALSVIVLSDQFGLKALVYGFITGNGVVLIVLSSVYSWKVGWKGLIKGFKLKPKKSGLWKAAFIVFLGEICYQGFNMSERSIASTFSAGTISAFYYAWILVAVPLSLVISPLSTVVYPKLAKSFTENKIRGYRLLKQYMVPLFLFSLLVVSGVSWLSDFLVKLIFMRGNFNASDAQKTADILSVLIFSLPFSSFGRLVRYSLYSLSDYKGASLSQLVTVLTLLTSAHFLTPLYGIIGLAYSCTIALSFQSIFMLILLRRQITK